MAAPSRHGPAKRARPNSEDDWPGQRREHRLDACQYERLVPAMTLHGGREKRVRFAITNRGHVSKAVDHVAVTVDDVGASVSYSQTSSASGRLASMASRGMSRDKQAK